MKPSFNLAVAALAIAIGAVTALATWPVHAATRDAGEPELRVHRDRAAPRGEPPAASEPRVAAAATASTAGGAVVTRNSGNTPNLNDFGPVFAHHPNQAGYNETKPDHMFLDTFRGLCPTGQHAVSANFKITVKKLQGGTSNDALAFWDGPPSPVFNTHLWSPGEAAGTVKTLNFNLAALPPAGSPFGYNQPPSGPVINSPAPPANPAGNGLGLLSDGDFSFSVQDDTSVLDASLEFACRDGGATSERKGMTWGVYPDHPVSGVTTVSCQGAPGGNCNAYVGDTPGSTALPVLCAFPANQPLPASMAGNPSAAYWSGDIVATTPAVSLAGAGLTTRAAVNAYCASQFGPGWKVAEFHMGANLGWKFAAYGHVGPAGASRFWVDINDQPNANFWQ